jgi:hypothetical protein
MNDGLELTWFPVLSSGIERRVIRWKSTDVSEEYIASIIRVGE